MSASNTKTCAPRTVAAAAILMVQIWGKQLHIWIVSVGVEFMRLRCARCTTPVVPQGLMKGLIEHAFSFLPMIASIDQFRQLIGAIMSSSAARHFAETAHMDMVYAINTCSYRYVYLVPVRPGTTL